MPDLGRLLKSEIARLAARVMRADVTPLKRDVVALKRDVSALRKTLLGLERSVKRLVAESESQRTRRLKKVAAEEVEKARITPGWIARVREKLGFSRGDFAQLVGVTANAVYLWESGRSRPRKTQRAALIEVRQLGKREALRRLEEAGRE